MPDFSIDPDFKIFIYRLHLLVSFIIVKFICMCENMHRFFFTFFSPILAIFNFHPLVSFIVLSDNSYQTRSVKTHVSASVAKIDRVKSNAICSTQRTRPFLFSKTPGCWPLRFLLNLNVRSQDDRPSINYIQLNYDYIILVMGWDKNLGDFFKKMISSETLHLHNDYNNIIIVILGHVGWQCEVVKAPRYQFGHFR